MRSWIKKRSKRWDDNQKINLKESFAISCDKIKSLVMTQYDTSFYWNDFFIFLKFDSYSLFRIASDNQNILSFYFEDKKPI